MRKLLLFVCCGVTLLVSAAPLAAQNTVDILGGSQPTNAAGCAVNPQCIPAVWSTTSNLGSDITTAITANFVFDAHGGASSKKERFQVPPGAAACIQYQLAVGRCQQRDRVT